VVVADAVDLERDDTVVLWCLRFTAGSGAGNVAGSVGSVLGR
jgi:hypothetical protein